jgi:hypothetical protein
MFLYLVGNHDEDLLKRHQVDPLLMAQAITTPQIRHLCDCIL